MNKIKLILISTLIFTHLSFIYSMDNKVQDIAKIMLLKAVKTNNLIMAQTAVFMGADVNCQDDEIGIPVLEHAFNAEADIKIIEFLIKSGANVGKEEIYDGFTPLMRACIQDNYDAVMLLINAKAKIDAKNHNGNTALMSAIESAYPKIVEALLLAGADANIKDRNNKSCTQIAIDQANMYTLSERRKEVKEILVNWPAKIRLTIWDTIKQTNITEKGISDIITDYVVGEQSKPKPEEIEEDEEMEFVV